MSGYVAVYDVDEAELKVEPDNGFARVRSDEFAISIFAGDLPTLAATFVKWAGQITADLDAPGRAVVLDAVHAAFTPPAALDPMRSADMCGLHLHWEMTNTARGRCVRESGHGGPHSDIPVEVVDGVPYCVDCDYYVPNCQCITDPMGSAAEVGRT